MKISSNGKAVLEARYLRRDTEGKVEETPTQMLRRVADGAAAAEIGYGMGPAQVREISDDFYRIMDEGEFLPNSPTLMNAGREDGMLSACSVIPILDSVESIFSAVRHAALVQKAGGGTGFSFSRLRPTGDLVASSGGTTSGPISFMRVFAEATNAIQQGSFRRGANMGILRIDHPDIIDFIDAKRDPRVFTNFNFSVAVSNQFMETLLTDPDAHHIVVNPRTGLSSALVEEDGEPWSVGQLFDRIVFRAWETGEPGVVFIDVMNEANPTPHIGAFESTNACGEQPLLPYESCNLGSINLLPFVRVDNGPSSIDREGLASCVRTATRFLDDVIDVARFPLPEFADAAKGNRKIGLGIMGFADALFALQIPYDSEEAIELGAEIMQLVNDESHKASIKLAEERGTFPNWKGSTWANRGIRIRNACTTCVAPTGSISVIAGCSGGIEPAFALGFSRKVLDGQELVEMNSVLEDAAHSENILTNEFLRDVAQSGSIQSMRDVPEHLRRVFVTAHDIAPKWHVRMQAAFQQHCDASISKTINLKNNATRTEVRDALLLAYHLGCKGVTVYRDRCRRDQPMAVRMREDTSHDVAKPMDLPCIMPATRVKQSTPFGNMHVKVVVDPDDKREREVFAQLGKGGDLANSDLEAICRLVSLYLRVNGDLNDVISQLKGIGSSLSIPTKEGRISSLADGLARALTKYRSARDVVGLESLLLGRSSDDVPANIPKAVFPDPHGSRVAAHGFRLKCVCGSDLFFTEGCVKCFGCGFSEC